MRSRRLGNADLPRPLRGRAEARFRRRDGEYRWFLVRVTPLRDDAGRIVRWYATGTDIDERKRAEEALRESEERFRTLVDHATDSFGLVDERGIIVDVNREACESRGYRREEMIGMSVSELDPDVDLDAIQKRFEAGSRSSRSRAAIGGRTERCSRLRSARAASCRRRDVCSSYPRARHHRAQARRGGAAGERGALPRAHRGVAANGVDGTRRRIKHLLEPMVVRLHGAHAG